MLHRRTEVTPVQSKTYCKYKYYDSWIISLMTKVQWNGLSIILKNDLTACILIVSSKGLYFFDDEKSDSLSIVIIKVAIANIWHAACNVVMTFFSIFRTPSRIRLSPKNYFIYSYNSLVTMFTRKLQLFVGSIAGWTVIRKRFYRLWKQGICILGNNLQRIRQ